MVIPIVHCLRGLNAASHLDITIHHASAVLSLGRDDHKLTCALVKGLPNLQLVHATCDSFAAKSATASLSIRVDGELFHVAASSADGDSVEVQLPLADHSWYGLGHFMRQCWPLETGSLDIGPFYPFDNGPTGVCTLADPTLISTAGLLVSVDDSSPCLHLGLNSSPAATRPPRVFTTGSLNQLRTILPMRAELADGDGLLRIQSRRRFDWTAVTHPWRDDPDRHAHRDTIPQLRFCLGGAPHVRAASQLYLAKIAKTPRKCPPIRMLRDPIWTTWAQYGVDVDQCKVLEYAQHIVSRGLRRSVLEIDDRWSPKYGDLEFDLLKFPDPRAMVDHLHKLGFLVTLWVTPFAAIDSKAVTDQHSRSFFMHNEDGQVGSFDWWQTPRVAGLDVLSDAACHWFVARLQRLRDEYGIDGFKFDAGEPCFVPADSKVARDLRAPAEYTRRWVNNIAARFDVAEVRACAQRCQQLSPMARMLDRYSTWTLDNGLASVLSTALTSGVLGYPFVLPDMIGGNAYGNDSPDGELMIRWAQLNAALPAMQFSIAPWGIDDQCDKLCCLALRWREQFFWHHIKSTLKDAALSYTPIIRPMWWTDQRAAMSSIYDQFLVGDDLLVAPIIEPRAVQRKVTLPAGAWRRVQLYGVEEKHDTTAIAGRSQIVANAQLDDMPVYVRERTSPL